MNATECSVQTQREQRQAKQEIARLHQELVSCGVFQPQFSNSALEYASLLRQMLAMRFTSACPEPVPEHRRLCHLCCVCHQVMPCLMVKLKASCCALLKHLCVLCIADSAAQLAAVTAASGPEKENLVEGASAIVTAALQLQPLLARAQKLRAKDQTSAFKCGDNVNGELSNLCWRSRCARLMYHRQLLPNTFVVSAQHHCSRTALVYYDHCKPYAQR